MTQRAKLSERQEVALKILGDNERGSDLRGFGIAPGTIAGLHKRRLIEVNSWLMPVYILTVAGHRALDAIYEEERHE